MHLSHLEQIVGLGLDDIEQRNSLLRLLNRVRTGARKPVLLVQARMVELGARGEKIKRNTKRRKESLKNKNHHGSFQNLGSPVFVVQVHGALAHHHAVPLLRQLLRGHLQVCRAQSVGG